MMDPLLQEANASARHIVVKWIRKVFRETALQVLKASVTVEQDEATVNLRVTKEMLDLCDQACRRLGNLWSQKLMRMDQKEVSRWVEEVVDQGQFWEGDSTLVVDEAGGEPRQELDAGDDTRTSGRISSQDEWQGTPTLSVTKLRQIGKQGNVNDWIQNLDSMGLNRETMWPYNWALVEDAAREIPKRLHQDSGRETKPKVEYEIVPKSILKNYNDSNAEIEDEKATKIVSKTSGHVTFHLERKKRKALEAAEPDRVTQRPKREDSPAEDVRSPSTLGAESVWKWELTKTTIPDKHELESTYIHPDPKPISNHVLLGAMKHLGRIHFMLQNEGCDESNDSKRKRALRKAFKERLGSLQMIKDERDAGKLLTKMRRAYDGTNQVWFEFDLGECMLEVNDQACGERVLCAFSSIEVSLQDEDK